MCTTVLIGDRRIETVGEMRAILGRDVIVGEGYGAGWVPDDNNCLCCLDMKATAEAAGYVVDWDEWGETLFVASPPLTPTTPP